jgi:hypothetical protein
MSHALAGGLGERSGKRVAMSMARRPWEKQRGRLKKNLARGTRM